MLPRPLGCGGSSLSLSINAVRSCRMEWIGLNLIDWFQYCARILAIYSALDEALRSSRSVGQSLGDMSLLIVTLLWW